MDSSIDSPGEIAKQALTRLAKERLPPLPENYCRIYRKVDEKPTTWAAFCHYTSLIEEALIALLRACQVPGPGRLLDAETMRLARELTQQVSAAASEDDLKRVRDVGHSLELRMKRDLASGVELQARLVDLSQFVVASLAKVADEDQWLRSQLEITEELLGDRVSVDSVGKAKDILLGVVARQEGLRKAIGDAQQALKNVTSELIRQAASLVDDTVGYEATIAELGEHIQAANDLDAIKSVVGELDSFVKDMGNSVRSSHDNMSITHSRLVQAEKQIVDLRQHLAETSEKARRDNLTGALNRSGLEDIWRREVARAEHDKTRLSIGILDVDNFKLFNDRLGHTVGDEALVHLTLVIRNALHGTDTMARYGGEEFVILLPDTDASGAEAVMRRLQRELTKHFFLHGNDRLLITFSAGVTVVSLGDDTLVSAIDRADSALYEAKRSGKNRVMVA
jgi:diguanylate cyclase